jgi:hypothetical protein
MWLRLQSHRAIPAYITKALPMIRNILLFAILGAGMAGCSSMNLQGDQPADEPTYVTGSHLPSKSANSNSVKSMAPPTIDQVMKGNQCVGGACGGAK